MRELSERIREFIDEGATPVTVEEVLTQRSVNHSAPRHGWSTPAKVSIASLAAAIVALAIVLPLTVWNTNASPRITSPTNVPAWRLVSSESSPFRALPAGGQADLQCVTDLVCYSPGYGSTNTTDFYRTTDGGDTWHQTAAIPLQLRGGQLLFSCADAATCAVIGAAQNSSEVAEIAFTSDGGAQWTASPIPEPSGMADPYVGRISCADGQHCVVSVSSNGDGASPAPPPTGTFLSTADGGRTWTQAGALPPGTTGEFWTMTCSPDGSCIALSVVGVHPSSIVALHTQDWGATWTSGPPSVYNDAPILYASCGDATHCMLVPLAGPSNAPYEIATTSDAGSSWQVTGPPTGWENMPTAVGCAPGGSCWVAMSEYDVRNPAGSYSDPTIEVTHDGGLTWSALSLPVAKPPISDVLTLSCPPSGDGCMGIGNLQDHFVLPPRGPTGRVVPLSGPLVISNLPTSPNPGA
jgi:hypothetical protein